MQLEESDKLKKMQQCHWELNLNLPACSLTKYAAAISITDMATVNFRDCRDTIAIG
jgi:hypothetical protein